MAGPVRILTATALVVGIIAGCGGNGSGGGETGPQAASTEAAAFDSQGGPEQLAFDGAGNLYTSDCYAARVFVIDGSGVMKVVAGSGPGGFAAGFGGDGGPASKAQLFCPAGVALDGDGNLFVSDHGNHRIRKISTNGMITTVAGSGPTGIDRGSFAGDGGPAIQARLAEPAAIALDAEGNLYVADRDNEVVRRITPGGTITTVAGTGEAGYGGDGGPATRARLDTPVGLAIDVDGNVFVSDSANNRVRRIDTNGLISTVAGTGIAGFAGDGGPAIRAQLSGPNGLAFDAGGNLYIADVDSNRIRRIDPNGVITTAAGSGVAGSGGDGGLAIDAQLAGPYGVAVDRDGNLYVADNGNQRVRRIDTDGVITTVAGGS